MLNLGHKVVLSHACSLTSSICLFCLGVNFTHPLPPVSEFTFVMQSLSSNVIFCEPSSHLLMYIYHSIGNVVKYR